MFEHSYQMYKEFAIEAAFYISITNWIVIYTYYIKRLTNLKFRNRILIRKYLTKSNNITGVFIVVIIAMASNIFIFISPSFGGEVSVFRQILSAISLALPALLAFYFSKRKSSSKWLAFFNSFILALPFFIVIIASGIRFHLLFSVIGFIIIWIYRKSFSLFSISLIFIFAVVFTFFSFSIKSKKGILAGERIERGVNYYDEALYNVEGIIYYTALEFRYFNNAEYHLGKETAFILYFWVPRFIWPDKPEMMAYWLIRTLGTTGFDKGHSAEHGFAGYAYADFGWIGGVVFSFCIGILLFSLERNIVNAFEYKKDFSMLYTVFLFPWTFFFVRSPITSTLVIFGILLFLRIIDLLFITKYLHDASR